MSGSASHPQRYDTAALSFHWAIAALILADFAFGISFARFDPGDALYFPFAYDMHMRFGMWILVVAVLCVARRVSRPYPGPIPDMSETMRRLARLAHLSLYGFMVIVPLTGWIVLALRGKPPVLIGNTHWPQIPYLLHLPRPQRVALHDFLLPVHIWLAYFGMGIVAVHALAALYHHFFLRDEVLRRMLPRFRRRDLLQVGRH